MSLFTIYTYNGLEELREIQLDKDIFPFIFVETKNLLESDPNIFIDISSMIYLLQVNKDNRYAAFINLREMTEKTTIIIQESLADDAIGFFPLLFSSHTPYYQKNKKIGNEKTSHLKIANVRKPIYTYNNIDDLNIIIDHVNKNNIPIVTFSRAAGSIHSELEKLNKVVKFAVLDLTSTSYAIEDNKNLIYSLEQFLNLFPNIEMIILTAQVDKIIKFFPLYVENYEPIEKLFPDIITYASVDNSVCNTRKVTQLSTSDFKEFIKEFNHNLVGHKFFKERFMYCLKNFIVLNRVKEQKVLSIFLFGVSGVGKTEVARQIANGLIKDAYLARINFQNYSSQDALNSLIGSPAGYIGCEHGEFSDKIKKSKIGLILCDEFEKTTMPVFSFFLELLEEGRFTDSMAREYELDGYIIIFTSNLQDVTEYKNRIPLELQTRFDLVCEFQEPSFTEKTIFLELLLERAESKFIEQFSQIQMTREEKQQLFNFDYSNIQALRDIKRIFNNRLLDYFNSKGLLTLSD